MKRIIGYVNTADLNHMREGGCALTVINIAFGFLSATEKLYGMQRVTGWNSIHSEKQPGAENWIVLGGGRRLFPIGQNKRGKRRFACAAALENCVARKSGRYRG